MEWIWEECTKGVKGLHQIRFSRHYWLLGNWDEFWEGIRKRWALVSRSDCWLIPRVIAGKGECSLTGWRSVSAHVDWFWPVLRRIGWKKLRDNSRVCGVLRYSWSVTCSQGIPTPRNECKELRILLGTIKISSSCGTMSRTIDWAPQHLDLAPCKCSSSFNIWYNMQSVSEL